ncbi:endo-1,3-alpha-glucanase family glycosylhydrolase [Gemmatimonadota bacterium]
MCWAHFCGWGFDVVQQYDRPDQFFQFYDRPLLGKWIGTLTGYKSNIRNQIKTAMQYGINGFMVDIPDPIHFTSRLQILYEAAEGLPFKIALCLDQTAADDAELLAELFDYFNHYGEHPNNCFIEGKPVIFMWHPGKRDAEDWREIVDELKLDGHQAYWIVQPLDEGTLWEQIDTLDSFLQVFDGLYDFGVNGRTLDEMKRRLSRGRGVLNQPEHSGGILVAGITQGYSGPRNGYYRPYLNTETFRNNWTAATDNQIHADWVGLTTWNDYHESTHFEPSVWGRDFYLRLNQEYLRNWRGEPIPDRPPQIFISYHEEICLGDQLTIEIQCLPYTTPPVTISILVYTLTGELVALQDIPLPQQSHSINTMRIDEREFHSAASTLLIITRINGQDTKYLYPVTVRPGIMRSLRTVRVPLHELLPSASSPDTNSVSGTINIRSRIRSWAWAGKAELLRNGKVLQSVEIAKTVPSTTEAKFAITDTDQQYPRDLYVVRFTRADNKFCWSPPMHINRAGSVDNSEFTIPVIYRDGDFDECSPLFALTKPVQVYLQNARVNACDIYAINLPMISNGEDSLETGGWSVIPLYGGTNHRGGVDESAVPTHVNGVGPNDVMRGYLDFDGIDDRILLPTRSLPHGPLTVEAWVKPKLKPSPMPTDCYIFSDQNNGLNLGVNGALSVFAERDGRRISGTRLDSNNWSHIAAVYNGEALLLYINGELVNEAILANNVKDINSRPAIGCHCRPSQSDAGFSKHFIGSMAGFSIIARPLTPEEFVLRSWND